MRHGERVIGVFTRDKGHEMEWWVLLKSSPHSLFKNAGGHSKPSSAPCQPYERPRDDSRRQPLRHCGLHQLRAR